MLLKCIAVIIKPNEGKIVINIRTVFDSTQKNKFAFLGKISRILVQNYALFHCLTVYENIAFGLDKLSKIERYMKTKGLVDGFLRRVNSSL